jgi:hypothetical protein
MILLPFVGHPPHVIVTYRNCFRSRYGDIHFSGGQRKNMYRLASCHQQVHYTLWRYLVAVHTVRAFGEMAALLHSFSTWPIDGLSGVFHSMGQKLEVGWAPEPDSTFRTIDVSLVLDRQTTHDWSNSQHLSLSPYRLIQRCSAFKCVAVVAVCSYRC